MARHAGRGSVGPLSAAYAPAPGETATTGPTREAVAVIAVTLLRRAAAALVSVKLRLAGIPALQVTAGSSGSSVAMPRPAMMADVTRCEAQVALAKAQIVGSCHQAEKPGQTQSGWRGRVGVALARCGAGWRLREEGEQLRLARAGFVAVLLCAAVAAL